jgi:hypothetical protein
MKGRSRFKGDCTPRTTQRPAHPWRRAVWFHAAKNGSYTVDAKQIERRRKAA